MARELVRRDNLKNPDLTRQISDYLEIRRGQGTCSDCCVEAGLPNVYGSRHYDDASTDKVSQLHYTPDCGASHRRLLSETIITNDTAG